MKNRFDLLSLLVTLVGAGFCLANALGRGQSLCFSEGCLLYRNVKILGISLWYFGVAAFLTQAVMAAVGRTKSGFFLSLVYLAIDSGFLAWLAFTATCFSCLLVALLFVLALFSFYLRERANLFLTKPLLLLWFFFLAPNVISLTQEVISAPWPVSGRQTARIQIFFSPTCPACENALGFFLADPNPDLALYPVSRSDRDSELIEDMLSMLQRGHSLKQALNNINSTPHPSSELNFFDRILTRWRVFCNKVAMSRMHQRSLPLILMTGAPVAEGGVHRQK
ncbi:MAG: hypothetical protein HQK55_03365 [Deltaproteobacteria bacterium]|nr:hypothetical protein [Deltaproteobacteria bacterium]